MNFVDRLDPGQLIWALLKISSFHFIEAMHISSSTQSTKSYFVLGFLGKLRVNGFNMNLRNSWTIDLYELDHRDLYEPGPCATTEPELFFTLSAFASIPTEYKQLIWGREQLLGTRRNANYNDVWPWVTSSCKTPANWAWAVLLFLCKVIKVINGDSAICLSNRLWTTAMATYQSQLMCGTLSAL